MTQQILFVGHCGPDSSDLSGFITRTANDAEITRAINTEEAETLLAEKSFDLVLPNRIIPNSTVTGQEWISGIKKNYPDTPFILISDSTDAQTRAEQNGAMPGFGKAELGTDKAQERLKAALEL